MSERSYMVMKNHSPRVIGFLQALGLCAYIALFSTTVFLVQRWVVAHAFQPHPVLVITSFLLAFVISALISGSLILAYPATLFFDGKKQEALRIIFLSAIWLIAIFLIAAAVVFLVRV